MSLPKIFFFHNPKAGGTSVSEWLLANYNAGETAPNIVNDHLKHCELDGNYDAYCGYSFYAGHYGRDIYDCVNDGHFPITNFRHPIQRLISLYNFFRFVVPSTEEIMTHPRYVGVQAAKRLCISAFLLCDEPDVAIYTRNFHVRQLTRSGFDEEADLSSAMGFVQTMPWYYLAEEPDRSLYWAQSWLCKPLTEIPRSNKTPEHNDRIYDISDSLKSDLLKINELDYELYMYARSRMLSAIPLS